MSRLKQPVRALLVGTALMGLSGMALADGYGYGGSVKDAPVAEGRKLDFSVTVGGTSDYIFRGISQTDEDPAAQGSIDLTYGIFYAGIWGTNVDFGPGSPNAEVDFYAGIKPTLGPGPLWGPVTFDFGVIYYAYPDADDAGAELDYVELKAGYSMESPWIKGLTTGTTLYWTPENTGDTGEVFTLESAASYTLPQVGIVSPALTGAYGTVYGDDDFAIGTNADDEYSYWNAGLELTIDKVTLDFRYWDTDIKGGLGGLADERFVFSASFTLP